MWRRASRITRSRGKGALSSAQRMAAASVLCVAALSASFAETTTYTYDAHGRLTGVVRGVNSVTYGYDAAGNLASPNPPFQATPSATSWMWHKIGVQPPRITPPTIVVTASGGTAPYSYLWQRVSGDTVATVTSATSHTTAWSRATTTIGVNHTSQWRCRVTDAASVVTYTSNVGVSFFRESL